METTPEKLARNPSQLFAEKLEGFLQETTEDPRTARRREFLELVGSAICQDRQNSYGHAEDNFATIARMFNEIRPDLSLTYLDVAIFMIVVKVARLRSSPEHLDNYIDLAGYAGCAYGIACDLKERGNKPS